MCTLLTKAVSPKMLSDAMRANVAAKAAITRAWGVVLLRWSDNYNDGGAQGFPPPPEQRRQRPTNETEL